MLRIVGRLARSSSRLQPQALRALTAASFHVSAAVEKPIMSSIVPRLSFLTPQVHFFTSSAEQEQWKCTVFIGGLPYDTEEDHIANLFGQFGDVVSVRMPKRRNGKPMGTCFVQFSDAQAALSALELDGEQCGSRYMAVKMAEAPRKRESFITEKPEGCTNIRFANVPFNTTEEDIREIFSHCGDISSVYFPKDKDTGRLLGYGFVEFINTESTDKAIELDESDFNGRTLRVNYSVKNTKKRVFKPEGCKAIYVGNISSDVNSGMLNDMFSHCGEIVRVHIAIDRETEEPRGFAYVNFANTESVDEAIKLSGAELDGQSIRVAFAHNREDRPRRDYDNGERGYGRTHGDEGYGGRGKSGGRDNNRRARRESHDF
ncbi:nucleolin [Thraustotheca clavata]|uniref:Nucleolin n=1 Tax=Thraustotheca clavata TaxID=74557 RepID=A0A1W0A519_9STRA|nr:nucleolin [Thraustotheca clavata]